MERDVFAVYDERGLQLGERNDNMTKNTVAVIFGTRPEAIKLAPVAQALATDSRLTPLLINTGQHDSLMPTIMEWFGVTIDQRLSLLVSGQPLGILGGKLLHRLTEVLADERPAMVIVQGDTLSAQMGALAAFYQQIPVAHVEAGLRTYNRLSPYPEEVARRMVSIVAALHFAPTDSAADNLRHEGVEGQIVVTGNPVVDALQYIRQITGGRNSPHPSERFRIVATIHRRENHAYLADIFGALVDLARRPGVDVILPLHANPAVTQAAQTIFRDSPVQVIAPMDYVPWIQFLTTADLLISDSGGIQEEAPVLGIPLLVTRDVTERPEVLQTGHAVLVGHNRRTIVEAADHVITGRHRFSATQSPFGDGHAAARIAGAVATWLESVHSLSVPS